MGSTVAMGWAEQVALGNVKLEQAILYHITGNFYPPHPAFMLEPCLKAIKAYNEGDFDKKVRLPEGVLWRGKRLAPVSAIIEDFRLDFFLDGEEEEFFNDEIEEWE